MEPFKYPRTTALPGSESKRAVACGLSRQVGHRLASKNRRLKELLASRIQKKKKRAAVYLGIFVAWKAFFFKNVLMKMFGAK